MKSFKRLSLLSLVSLTLTACGGAQHYGKLPAEYYGQNIDADIAVHSERKLQVQIIDRGAGATGGGLIGALAVGIIAGIEEGNARMTGADRIKQMNANFHYDYVGKIEEPRNRILQNASWLKVNRFIPTDREDGKSASDIFEIAAKDTQSQYVGVMQNALVFSEDFSSFTNSLHMQIKTLDAYGNPDDVIYRTYVSDIYNLEGAERMEGEENYPKWLYNDGAEIRKALDTTTRNVHTKLKQQLSDPYLPTETTEE